MPKRTNLIQKAIKLIEEAKGDFLSIEESALIPDKDTGELREVDILLKGVINGHPLFIAFEIVDRSRKADVVWVEQIISKHASLMTDKLVLVSNSGYTRTALLKAEQNNVKVIDFSKGDKKLRDYLKRAAYIQGVIAQFSVARKIKGKLKIISLNKMAQIGKLRGRLGGLVNDMLEHADIKKAVLNIMGEKEEADIEIYFPSKVKLFNDDMSIDCSFQRLYIWIHLKTSRVPIRASSGQYDGVEFIVARFEAGNTIVHSVHSKDGKIAHYEKTVDKLFKTEKG